MKRFLFPLALIPLLLTLSCGDGEPSKSSDDFHKKYIFVKALDETMYKEMGGIFNKVEIGTTDRVEITLDIKNKVYYGLAQKLAPKCKEVGFTTLRIKDTHSDRYEDFPL
jgi:hypothetical protein